MLVGGVNKIKSVDVMNPILTQDLRYGWARQSHSVKDRLGRGRGGASSHEKPWQQKKPELLTSGNREREVQAGRGRATRLAEWRG